MSDNAIGNSHTQDCFITVIKRDGRIVPFDETKIADAIFKAAVAVGGEDRLIAEELASAVALFLKKKFGPQPPTIEEIQDVVEKVLIETGHARTAKAYIIYREKRANARKELKVRKKIREETNSTDLSLLVTPLSKDEILSWDKAKIALALQKEADLDVTTAYEIASAVEDKIFSSKITHISTSLIRELVDNELFIRGLGKKLATQAIIGMPTYDLETLIFSKSQENSNILANNPEAVNLAIAETTLKQYALQRIFSQDIAEAHMKGEIHLHDLGYPTRVYSFSRDEVVYVKEGKDGIARSLTLGNLFEMAALGYEADGYQIRPLHDYYIRDRDNSWTKLLRVVRHKAEKKMLFIKTQDGSAIIVTADHPMIDADMKQIEAKDIIPDRTKLITYNPPGSNNGLAKELDLVKELIKLGRGNFIYLDKTSLLDRKDFDSEAKIQNVSNSKYKDSCPHLTNGKEDRIPAKFPLNGDTGWLIGLFASEGSFTTVGCCDKRNKKYRGKNYLNLGVTITSGEKESTNKTVKILNSLGIDYCIDKKGKRGSITIQIYNSLFAQLLREVLNIQYLSGHKILPQYYPSYNRGFLQGVLAGIIDGDGTIKTKRGKDSTNVVIGVSSKTLATQLKDVTSILGFQSSLRNGNGADSLRIYKGRGIRQNHYLNEISFRITQKVYKLLKPYSIRISNGEFKVARESSCQPAGICTVVSVEEANLQHEYVYDVTTESGMFVCSGILTHNCSSHSLEYLKRYGLHLGNLDTQSAPAKHARTLTGHLNTFLASMQAYYAGALGVGYINIMYAPYLEGMGDKELLQEAQHLIFSGSQNAFSRGGQSLFIDHNIHTGIPNYLRKIPAIGPGGKYTGKTYGDYEETAQRFTTAMLTVWRQGDKDERPFAFPKSDLHISYDTFKDTKQREILDYACQIASENGTPYFVFDRNEVTLSACCRLRTQIKDNYMIEHPESMRFVGFQNITINLPQAAYRAGKGNIDGLYREIERCMGLVIKAHLQKKGFIWKLMSEPGLPMWEVGKIALDGRPYVDLDKATYIIGLIGLNECVQHLTGRQLHEDEDVFKLGLKIVSFMYFKAKEAEKRIGLKFSLEESPAESATRRLAKVDLRQFPEEASNVVKGDIEADMYYYTNSIHFAADAPLDIVTRIQKQSKFHSLIESGAIIHAFVGERLPSKESIMNLVEKTYYNTQAAQITISPEFTVCNNCHKRDNGLHDKCRICGSEDVYGMTRIVGYYSRINNWNRSKLGELADRRRYQEHYAIPELIKMV